ncbi:hypothetical protein QKW34_19250 [Bacillus licheniformis]|nr:hypothetical protein QKW34_19250 [Bacillus licheniformis]
MRPRAVTGRKLGFRIVVSLIADDGPIREYEAGVLEDKIIPVFFCSLFKWC